MAKKALHGRLTDMITSNFAKKSLFICLPALIIFLASCGDEGTKKEKPASTQTQPAYAQRSPAFNADSAYYFVKRQVDFGPRVTASEASKKCGDWLVEELKQYADNVLEQYGSMPFNGKPLKFRNIIAEFNPMATRRIMFCAHWDSRPYADKDVVDKDKPIAGANDGASGVGVLLEMARLLKANPLNIGVDLILFDAEDLGNASNDYCLGSQYWSKNLHKPGYKAEFGILLDMVGAPGAKFAWEGFSVQYAKPVVENVWATARNLGYSNHFIYFQNENYRIEDDHYYVNRDAGIPCIDIIHFEANSNGSTFPEHHHTHRDNMSVIDRNTLKAVGQTMMEVLYTAGK
jgi:hypothetical protein